MARGIQIGSRVREVMLEALRKDRLTVKLTDSDSARHGEFVMATVEGPWAEIWADNDQTIGGDTWEYIGNGAVYAMPCNHPGLVAELKAEGYSLDLSEYSDPEPFTPCDPSAGKVCDHCESLKS